MYSITIFLEKHTINKYEVKEEFALFFLFSLVSKVPTKYKSNYLYSFYWSSDIG